MAARKRGRRAGGKKPRGTPARRPLASSGSPAPRSSSDHGSVTVRGDAVRERLSAPAERRRLALRGEGRGLAWYAFHYLRLATPPCHLRWYSAFDRAQRLLFLAPRSHGKSISVGRVLVGHRIVTNRNLRILLIGRTASGAAKTARLVRRDLEKNTRIAEDWQAPEAGGPFREKGLSWTDKFFYVRRTRDARDPTVEAVGVGGAITGGRFDLIVLDDPIDDVNTRTEAQRRKVRDWFYGTVMELLDVGGRVVVIGTRKHAADLYATLEKDPTFDVVQDRAIVEWPDMQRVEWVEREDERTGRRVLVDVVVPEGQGKVLWREKWDLKALLKKWRSMGSVLFNRENQNEVVDDGSSPFKLSWLEAARARGATRGFLTRGWLDADDEHAAREHPLCEGLYVYQCWDFALITDPALAQQADGDWTVGQTWGLDWTTGDRYLLRAVRRQGLSQGQLLALIREEAARFPQLIALVVENNAFGRLHEIGLRRTTGLPIYGHTTDKRKHDPFEGVPGMSALFEGVKVVLPYAAARELGAHQEDPRPFVDTFCVEHHGFGNEAHDDTVMGHWVGDVWIRRFIAAEERRRRQGRRAWRSSFLGGSGTQAA